MNPLLACRIVNYCHIVAQRRSFHSLDNYLPWYKKVAHADNCKIGHKGRPYKGCTRIERRYPWNALYIDTFFSIPVFLCQDFIDKSNHAINTRISRRNKRYNSAILCKIYSLVSSLNFLSHCIAIDFLTHYQVLHKPNIGVVAYNDFTFFYHLFGSKCHVVMATRSYAYNVQLALSSAHVRKILRLDVIYPFPALQSPNSSCSAFTA